MVSLEDLANRMGRLENLITSKYITPELTTLEAQVAALEAKELVVSNNVTVDTDLTLDGDFHNLDLSSAVGANTALMYIYLRHSHANTGIEFKLQNDAGEFVDSFTNEAATPITKTNIIKTNSSGVIKYRGDAGQTIMMIIQFYRVL